MKRVISTIAAFILAVPLAACAAKFDFTQYTSNEAIYRASLAALEEGKEGLAVQGFERLRDNVPQRDPMRVMVHFYLAKAYSLQKEPLKASGEYRRIFGLFSADTLADDALFLAAREERKLWKHYELDDTYGRSARQLLQQLLTSYPDSPLREDVFREDRELEELFATKLFENGMDLYRDGQNHPAIIYYRAVLDEHPASARALEARFMIVRAYRKEKWATHAEQECVVLRQMYRDDPKVRELCGVVVSSPPATR